MTATGGASGTATGGAAMFTGAAGHNGAASAMVLAMGGAVAAFLV